MNAFLLTLMPLTASAGTVEGGVQVAAFASGFDFVADRFTGEVFNINKPLVSKEDVGCYDEVGLRNLNVEIPIQKLAFDLNPDSIVIDVHFGLIHGSDMELYAEDSDTWDACISMSSIDFRSFELDGGRILVELAPSLNGDNFALDVIGEPAISGSLSTDIEWVPDSLILSFVEDSIFEAIENAMAEQVPALAAAMVDTSLFVGEVGDIRLDVALTDIDTSASEMAIGMDVDTEWLGDGCTISGIASEPEGRNNRVNFGGGQGNDVAVAITEYQLNRLFHGAWADGLLCFDDGPLGDVADSIEETIGSKIDNSAVELSFSQAPAFLVDTDGIRLSINGLHMALSGEVGGQDTLLLSLDADLALQAEVRIDHTVSAVALSLTGAELNIARFEADPLLKDATEAKERLTDFLQGWAMDTLSARISDVPLYSNLFHIADVYLRINSIDTEGGAVAIMGKLFDGDDPAVDIDPPETLARIVSMDNQSLVFEMDAEDDSSDPIAFSYRLDDADWSTWSGETMVTISLPNPGTHNISIRARDAWQNVDPSPTALLFEVAPLDDTEGCQCTAQGRASTGVGMSLMVMLLGLTRRRE
jgi:hypothetical protein